MIGVFKSVAPIFWVIWAVCITYSVWNMLKIQKKCNARILEITEQLKKREMPDHNLDAFLDNEGLFIRRKKK